MKRFDSSETEYTSRGEHVGESRDGHQSSSDFRRPLLAERRLHVPLPLTRSSETQGSDEHAESDTSGVPSSFVRTEPGHVKL